MARENASVLRGVALIVFFCMQLFTPYKEYKAGESEYDARLLPLVRDGAGGRHYDWRPLCEKLESFTYKDWPVPGPRTVGWICRF